MYIEHFRNAFLLFAPITSMILLCKHWPHKNKYDRGTIIVRIHMYINVNDHCFSKYWMVTDNTFSFDRKTDLSPCIAYTQFSHQSQRSLSLGLQKWINCTGKVISFIEHTWKGQVWSRLQRTTPTRYGPRSFFQTHFPLPKGRVTFAACL
jgi:hypothetical protein